MRHSISAGQAQVGDAFAAQGKQSAFRLVEGVDVAGKHGRGKTQAHEFDQTLRAVHVAVLFWSGRLQV
ncbi:MAG: hypothetical protein FIA97_16745 [Methylococcaceae bacterium]|nr:hypothetical protein [Methylococcaceae bacterium]